MADSAQLFNIASLNGGETWLDVGSGGGLPGLVIATLAKSYPDPIKVKLVESDGRKCAFLRTVVRELDLSAEIIEDRIEHVNAIRADIISARAFADLSTLLEISQRQGKKQAICLFLKGQNYDAELTTARHCWHINVETISSMTDSSACILKIKEITRASET